MTTIQEVAKMAGVSIATVSRVLNDGVVSPETKILVKKAIKELNYKPNMLGRNLRKSESKMILIMIPDISNPFYSKVIKGIEDSARKHGYNILLCNTYSDRERETVYMDLLRHKLADGIITMDPATKIEVLKEIARDYPMVQCFEYDNKTNIPYVGIDNISAACDATEHLLKSGYDKIALINTDENFMYAKQRKKGYLKTLKKYNLPIREEWIINTELSFESGYKAMKNLLLLEEMPTAIFAVSDILAIGALKAVRDEKITISKEVGIIGFDNIEFTTMTNPTLTTVDQPRYKIGVKAADILIKIIKNQKEDISNLIFEHEILARESTKQL